MKIKSIKSLTDKDMELLIGWFLRLGVVIACMVAFTGGVIYLYEHGMEPVPDYKIFKQEPLSFTTLSGILKGVLSGHSADIIQMGVVLLIATPVLRIVLSLFSFTIKKDRLYIFITSVVLFVILFSMLSGTKL